MKNIFHDTPCSAKSRFFRSIFFLSKLSIIVHEQFLSKVIFYILFFLLFSGNDLKQDHQRWGYSTVIHLEKTIYLATWKDLNKEKRKEQ